ncbi:MAG: methyl-accepting chemotaxis protein [Eubacteriales bacterium]
MNKTKKFKSIQKVLLGRIRLALISLSCMLFCMILSTASILTQDTLEITMKQMATNSAEHLTSQVSIFQVTMKEIPNFSAFEDPQRNREEVIEILNAKSAEYWCLTSFVDLDGNDFITGNNVSGETFFQKGIGGESYISAPVVASDNSVSYIISCPTIVNEEVIGVMYMTPDYDYLYSLVTANSVGVSGHTYIISTRDEVIMDEDIVTGIKVGSTAHLNKHETHLNFEQNAKDSVGDGGIGFGNFFESGTVRVGGYAPVPGTDGWVLITTAESFEFLELLPTVVFGALCLTILMTIFFGTILSTSINNVIVPINKCIERILSLASGDLQAPVPEIKRNDEVGLLADSTKTIVDSLSNLIEDEQLVLGELAHGNFAVHSRNPEAYIGDFAPLYHSLQRILENMNQTMSQISQASEKVTDGAKQMASSSSSLAEGATTQATSTKELSSNLDHISEQVATSTQRATDARALSERTGEEVRSGNEFMIQLLQAMDDIAVSSQKIEQIIKNIEDIAFQTNILALNAAVEAARAGSAGSGFAVVADEVRNLANRSAENAKQTADLIDSTLLAVRNGTGIANKTAQSLSNVVVGVEEAIVAIHDIALAMEEQSGEIEKITGNMESISGVIEDTSATSKESAHTSHQLSAQADSLRELLEHFKLRDNQDHKF